MEINRGAWTEAVGATLAIEADGRGALGGVGAVGVGGGPGTTTEPC